MNTITTHQKEAAATQSFTKTNFFSGKTEVGKKLPVSTKTLHLIQILSHHSFKISNSNQNGQDLQFPTPISMTAYRLYAPCINEEGQQIETHLFHELRNR